MNQRRCDGVARRDFLRVGALSAMGMTLPDLLRRRSWANTDSPRAKNCILIWLDGGPSHLEMFDPKPDAPVEIRGPLKPISTSVAGIQLSESMPKIADRMHRLSIVRSVTSTLGEHNFGTHYLLTGYRPTPAIEYPFFGSVVTHVRQTLQDLPPNIAIPSLRVGGGKYRGNGYLPPSTFPFELRADPAAKDFRIPDLQFHEAMSDLRLQRRREYVKRLERLESAVEKDDGVSGDAAFDQAFRLMTSAPAREAFNLDQEPREVREQYGPKTVGQGCLLARRLVERGVPFVTVNNPGWDTHRDMYTRLVEGYTGARVPVGLVPSLDRALSSLIDDLVQRGLLDETLIVVMGEFGRTPRLNTDGGRDHWPRAFSVLLAGAGIPGGQVVGASDSIGESPHERPVTPADLAATIYTLLGIDPNMRLTSPDGRPVPLNLDGVALPELIG